MTALAPVVLRLVDRFSLTKLHAVLADAGFERGVPATDLLDPDIRSARTRRQLEASASPISRRWGIVTGPKPEDFIHAQRRTHVDR